MSQIGSRYISLSARAGAPRGGRTGDHVAAHDTRHSIDSWESRFRGLCLVSRSPCDMSHDPDVQCSCATQLQTTRPSGTGEARRHDVVGRARAHDIDHTAVDHSHTYCKLYGDRCTRYFE